MLRNNNPENEPIYAQPPTELNQILCLRSTSETLLDCPIRYGRNDVGVSSYARRQKFTNLKKNEPTVSGDQKNQHTEDIISDFTEISPNESERKDYNMNIFLSTSKTFSNVYKDPVVQIKVTEPGISGNTGLHLMKSGCESTQSVGLVNGASQTVSFTENQNKHQPQSTDESSVTTTLSCSSLTATQNETKCQAEVNLLTQKYNKTEEETNLDSLNMKSHKCEVESNAFGQIYRIAN